MLSLVIFAGATGVVFNKHYCQNQLKSTAVFFHAQPCYAKDKVPVCPVHAEMNVGHESNSGKCCDNRVTYVHSDDDKVNSEVHQFTDLIFDLSPPFHDQVQMPFESFDVRTAHYLNYKPPLIVCDLPSELQTFLF